MTVAELIQKLSECDQTLEVKVLNDDFDEFRVTFVEQTQPVEDEETIIALFFDNR